MGVDAGIEAFLAVHEVRSALLGVDHVGRAATIEEIVAGSAEKRVGTTQSEEEVVASEASESVVPVVAAEKHVGTVVARENGLDLDRPAQALDSVEDVLSHVNFLASRTRRVAETVRAQGSIDVRVCTRIVVWLERGVEEGDHVAVLAEAGHRVVGAADRDIVVGPGKDGVVAVVSA